MGTSPETAMMDKLGRRSGPRRKYTIDEKRVMVAETRQPGASVPEVAQRHGVNANLLSAWRRLERPGLLVEGGTSKALLPVKVSTPTILPSATSEVHGVVDGQGSQRCASRALSQSARSLEASDPVIG
jgi:transposase